MCKQWAFPLSMIIYDLCDPIINFVSNRTPEFYDWGFNLSRGQALLDKWNEIPEGIDILMTHGPPLGNFPMIWSNISPLE